MYRNFMIGFTYQGYFYCANVHKHNQSPVEYHITILANKAKDELPSRIILKDEGHGPRITSREPVSPALVEIIVDEIRKRA